jgi:energy-coupling factor transporter ATP-binding protein EcfA2
VPAQWAIPREAESSKTVTKHLVSKVFTPTTPAKLSFVERDAINDRLVDALTTPGKQVVVFGHSGSGKTTLLRYKLEQLYEGEITTRCTNSMTFDSIVLDAFDQLGAFYTVERSGSSTKKIGAEFKIEYQSIKAGMSRSVEVSKKETEKLILPPQLTAPTLARFLGVAGLCWVLEDFHKIAPSEKSKLAQMMKVFMDTAGEYPEVRTVAIGAVGTARQVIECDPEMRNRVAEIEVPLMTDDELREIICRGEDLLNVTFPAKVKIAIVKYSNGLASICHQICLNSCRAAGVFETCDETLKIDETHVEKGIVGYLEDASDTLKSTFDKALRVKKKGKFDNTRLIIKALVALGEDGATHADLLAEVKKTASTYSASNLNHFLTDLQKPDRGGVVRYDAASGRYSFSDPIYNVYARILFRDNSGHNPDYGDLLAELLSQMQILFEAGPTGGRRIRVLERRR